MLLEIDALDVRYGATHAVKGVSLTVGEGEIVTVLGANGAGKSSLLKAVAGAVKPAGGRLRFAGQDITGKGAAARVRAGLMLVPEGRQIFVSLSVEENLLMGAYTRSDADVARDAEAIFDRFPNLAARRDAPASVLSGGEQQMLAVGRALLSKPKLMMLDEPSLGLSPILVDQLQADRRVEPTGPVDPAGRTEHPHGAGDRRPRLRAGTGRAGRRRHRGGTGRRHAAGRGLPRLDRSGMTDTT